MTTFQINNQTDLFFAEYQLSKHETELPTQITEKAIVWQKGIIANLREAISLYNSDLFPSVMGDELSAPTSI